MLRLKLLKILFVFGLACLFVNMLCLWAYTVSGTSSAQVYMRSSVHLHDVYTGGAPGMAGRVMNGMYNSIEISDGAKKLHLTGRSSTIQSLNSDATVMPLTEIQTTKKENSNTRSWKKGTFCHNYIIDTFRESIPVCKNRINDQMRCYVNNDTDVQHMGQCIFRNFAMSPAAMKNVLPNNVRWNKPSNMTINLLSDTKLICGSATTDLLDNSKDGDYQDKLISVMLDSPRLSKAVCDVWINKTVLFHVSIRFHVYFKFLNFYNVHKTLIDHHLEEGDYHVMRISNFGGRYVFPKFEKKLFPGTINLDDFQENTTVCFNKVVNVPTCYQSVPFRCKMDDNLRYQCSNCDGRGLSGTPLQTFRRRVLHACNLEDRRPVNNSTSVITVILRKPYKRWSTDRAEKFQRILKNGDKMMDEIRHTFQDSLVNTLYLEDLDICDQVRYALEADIMMGVHGAGLVHFWWMREEATAIELEPDFEFGNPSFRMLTKLLGRKYMSVPIISSLKKNNTYVKADIEKVLTTIRQILKIV